MRHLHCDGSHWKYIFVWLHHVSRPVCLCLLPTNNDHLPSARKGRLGSVTTGEGKNKALMEHTYALMIQPGVKCFCRMCLLYYSSTDTSISAVSITFSNIRDQVSPRCQQHMKNPSYCYRTRRETKSPWSTNRESKQAFWREFSNLFIHCGVGGMHMHDSLLSRLRQCRNSSRGISLASTLLLLAGRVCFTN